MAKLNRMQNVISAVKEDGDKYDSEVADTQNDEKIESKTNQYNEESSQELTNVENKQQEDFATEGATTVDENSNCFQTSTTELPQIENQSSQSYNVNDSKFMEMYEKNIRPRDIMTEKAFLNALTVDMALGCSTNSMLHLPAIAHEAGVELNVDIANEISAKTPNLCHLAPAGPTYMEDLNEAGGVYAVMNELAQAGLIHTECMTVTGKTVGENIKDLSLIHI